MFESVRAFIALQTEIGAARRLAALQRDLLASPALPPVPIAWTSPANLRIDLRYLGRLEASVLPAILDPVRELVSPLPPLRIQIGPLAAFPSAQSARLIITQVTDPSGTLPDLVARLDALMDRLGLPAARTPFQPHFTLARLRDATDVQAWLASVELPLLEARLTECSIHRQQQKRPGGEHIAFDRFPLAPALMRPQRPSRAPKASQRPSRRPPRTADGTPPVRQDIPGPPRMPGFDQPAGPELVENAPARLREPEAPQQPPIPQPPASPAAAPPPAPASPAAAPPAPASPAAAPPPAPAGSSILPPAPDGLPPEDDWG